MSLWVKFYELWLMLVDSPLTKLFETFDMKVDDLLLNFFNAYRYWDAVTQSYKYPPLVTTIMDIIEVVIPDYWTVFGLMLGSALVVFLAATVIKWIIGIFT